MAVPNSRATLTDYCLRALGAPVIEINVDEDQISDRVDEALQFYQHYHSDAIEKVFLKHKITGSSMSLNSISGTFTVGEIITGGTTGATATVTGFTSPSVKYSFLIDSNTAFQASETITGANSGATAQIQAITKGDIENNYIPLSEPIVQVVRVLPVKNSSVNNIFDVKYQMHLNDLYSLGYLGSLLEYTMAQEYLRTLDLLICFI